MSIHSTGSSLSTLNNIKDPIQFGPAAPRTPEGMEPGYRVIFSLKTITRKTPATVVLSREACGDGMSDATYPYSVTYVSDIQVLEGCCSPGQ